MKPMVAFVLLALVVAVKGRFFFAASGDDEEMQGVGESGPPQDALQVVRVWAVKPPHNMNVWPCADWECTFTCWINGYPAGECDPDNALLCDCHK